MKDKVIFDFYDFEITAREIIVSIAIVAIWLILGFGIHEKIDNVAQDRNAVYTKALKITKSDEFQYGMETNVGNAFVYGNYEALDPVSYDEIEGEYSRVEKIKKRYTRHTRVVTKTKVVNGKTQTYTTTEVYYTWDVVNRDSKESTQVSFCGIEFDADKILLPTTSYIGTIKESGTVKYEYYGVPAEMVGTIYTNLSNGTIDNNSAFFRNQDPVSAMETLKDSATIIFVMFWIVWPLLLGGILYAWFYFDNHYLS